MCGKRWVCLPKTIDDAPQINCVQARPQPNNSRLHIDAEDNCSEENDVSQKNDIHPRNGRPTLKLGAIWICEFFDPKNGCLYIYISIYLYIYIYIYIILFTYIIYHYIYICRTNRPSLLAHYVDACSQLERRAKWINISASDLPRQPSHWPLLAFTQLPALASKPFMSLGLNGALDCDWLAVSWWVVGVGVYT